MFAANQTFPIMKTLLTLLFTCVSFTLFSQCLLDPNHYHCSIQMQKQMLNMQESISRLEQLHIPQIHMQKRVRAGADCWESEIIVNNDPAYTVNQNRSRFRYIIDPCGIAFVEYHIFITGLVQNKTQIIFPLPIGVDPAYDTKTQADLLFDAKFETSTVLINSTLKTLTFKRQLGKFYINPNDIEIVGRFFIRWQ